jgi:hypothetical protein
MTGMDDLVTWLRAQLDDDERWAVAANQPYPYSPDATAPPTGVHWQWVAGHDWEPALPDPVVDEFVAEPGYSCNLATVETWPSGTTGSAMPRTYANEIVEMDASAAGHIARWDPARVLAEVDAKRQILDLATDVTEMSHDTADTMIRLLALPYADRPGYREEWRP